jgi:hypothetical protein
VGTKGLPIICRKRLSFFASPSLEGGLLLLLLFSPPDLPITGKPVRPKATFASSPAVWLGGIYFFMTGIPNGFARAARLRWENWVHAVNPYLCQRKFNECGVNHIISFQRLKNHRLHP